MRQQREHSISTDRRTTTRTGHVRFGSRRTPALAVALPTGLVLAAGFGVVAAAAGIANGPFWAVAAFFGLISTWAFVALVWIAVVDPDSLRGRAPRTEESVESAWFEKAASASFTDLVIVSGLALAAVAVTDVEISAILVLTGVVVISLADLSVRYLLNRGRG
ncbi:hypothetical protein [Litorihabitans aurantiacus]|uniref:Uncharacterized protein n=1 Tax=Litorihabitans aurantiacus TaxID=1930061 RepID=A0AA37XBA3_9MICO|nr:hypothetical protein [Litorihabitans aurantiacus]GMA30824.1 hypothetical protein GCM10025875_08160 [Litorihabitans aurantiacus]